ncbi:alpha/beta fold hydrolase [Novosphingobium sp. YJ-S2-02]|uniref:Alpha/beta fold hydrolase n=1 Tax=Novosphingobium aureum TaxID=2792964 RepID=A0A931MJU3_9SPHN|nr:alpha/beta fold hydrolase [Novosphingobium aureum]MBH0111789.1 alpha/beta fold hydrolase [Novosphingobium aureum]
MNTGERQPLVLIPGLSCDARLWQAQVEGLDGVARTMVGDTLSDASIAAMAQRILADAPERFALAGFSMGGYVAMEISRRAPERVTRLALLDTTGDIDTPEMARVRRAAVTTAQSRGYEAVLRGSLNRLVHPETANEVGEEVVAMALGVGLETYIDQQNAIVGRADSRGELASLDVPALVLVGAQDRLTPPRYSQELAEIIPGARYAEIQRAGHMTPMEQPEAVNQALREWLAA